MGRTTSVLGLVIVLVVSLSSGAQASSAGTLRAVLHGAPIGLDQVGNLHCHDFDHPVIRCFRTRTALEKAVAPRTSRPWRRGPMAALAVSYVRVFENAAYNGSSAYLSADYHDLATIGWNDRITSFKSVNSGSGNLWEHANEAGARYAFCCNVSVSNVGAKWNDLFSSVAGSA